MTTTISAATDSIEHAKDERVKDEHVLVPYVPRIVREWQPDPDDDGRILEVDGTLLSADLSGFTALSEKLARVGRGGAEELTDLLNTCFGGMIAAMDTCSGDVLKFGGDALLVLFTGEGHAARACRAAVATRALIKTPLQRRDGAEVQLRISQGVHSGRFLLCAVRGNHVEVLISGPDATEAVSCESAAAPGDILLSPATAALIDPAWIGAAKSDRRLLRARLELEGDDFNQTQHLNLGVAQFTNADHIHTYVPAAQREQIAAASVAEHRRATVGFLKFTHTDALVRREGGAALARHLAQLARAVACAESAHAVHWLSTDIYPDGGKLILTAGAPVSSGHDEEAMLDALRDILDAGIELDLGAGVHAGPVFAGGVGSQTRRVYTVMGDTVNLAARLMQKAKSDQLVASNAALQKVPERFVLTPLQPFAVKGKAEPIHAAVVGERRHTLARIDESSIKLVGREAELTSLRAAAQRAREGSGTVIDIVGDAGSGKTRLLQELRKEPGLDSIGVICGQYARTSPYFAVRLVLRRLAGIDPMTPPAEAGDELLRFIEATAPELSPWAPLLAVPFDAEVPSTEQADHVAPAHRRKRIHQLTGELLTAAVDRATAFVIDDAQWIDDASRELLEELTGIIAERPWLICISRRPGQPLIAAGDGSAALQLALEPLERDAALDLALAMAGDDAALPPDVWKRIVQQAAGNPLFVIELVSAAIERRGVDDVPDSVEAIVTSRIDTLSAADRMLLRDASVLGMVVDAHLLADALSDHSLRSPERWHGLEPFLDPLAPGLLTFRHELYRQAAYQGLSYRRRRQLHRRVGEVLEVRALIDPEDTELLSIHFARAEDHVRAWRYSVRAGDRAREKYANVEAATLYRRALESARSLDEMSPQDMVAVLESLGDVCELGARYDEAAHAYAEARRYWNRELKSSDARVTSFARLCRKSGSVEERRGRYVPALRWYGRGLHLLAERDSNLEASARAQLALAYAGVRYRQGRYREQFRWAQEAAKDAKFAGDQSAIAHAYFLLDLAYTSIGAPERGTYASRALTIFEQVGDYLGQSRALNNLGISAWRSGEWDRSFSLFNRSRQAYELSGDAVGAAMAANNAAEILSDQGWLDEAIAMYREALHTCKAARYPSGAAVLTGNLGQAVARRGDAIEGLALLDDSLALLSKIGATGYELEAAVKRVEALVLAHLFDAALEGSEQLLSRLTSNEEDVLAAMLQRQRAYAFAGSSRMPDAMLAIDDSVARAETCGADYELARSLIARAHLVQRADANDEARAQALMERLGVISVPNVLERGA